MKWINALVTLYFLFFGIWGLTQKDWVGAGVSFALVIAFSVLDYSTYRKKKRG